MQLFNGVSLRLEHYMNPKNLHMHQYDVYMRHDEP